MTVVSQAVAKQLSPGREPARRWVVQAEIDSSGRPGMLGKKKRRAGAVPSSSPRSSTVHRGRNGGALYPARRTLHTGTGLLSDKQKNGHSVTVYR